MSIAGVYEKVRRFEKIKVRALDLDGKERIYEEEGFMAKCMQHEIDHLNGRLFIDRLSQLKRKIVNRRFRRVVVSVSLRVAYAGTPAFAVPALERLLASNHHVCAVFSQPDRPSGRGKKLQASPVKQAALQAGISVYQPEKMGDEQARLLQSLAVDVLVVAAYGQIIPAVVYQHPCFYFAALAWRLPYCASDFGRRSHLGCFDYAHG